jgi:plastocyanin
MGKSIILRYTAIFVAVILVLSISGLLACTTAPSPTPTPSPTTSPTPAPTPGNVTINLVAKNIAFNQSTMTLPAGSDVTINFDNQDNGVKHNFAVYTDAGASTSIFVGEVITGPKTITYHFTVPSTPGTYFFRCDIHPGVMTGDFIVE